jgi:hypothetical protein
MALARAKGKLRGKQPKLSPKQQRELVRMAGTGEYTIADLAELFTAEANAPSQTLRTTVCWLSFGRYSSTSSTSLTSISYSKFLWRLYQTWSKSLLITGWIALRLRGSS